MTLDITDKQQEYTEKDIETLNKRLEAQKKLKDAGSLDPDVYNLNRIAIQKTLKAIEAIRSNKLTDPKTGFPVDGIVNGKLERYFHLVAKSVPPPFMKEV